MLYRDSYPETFYEGVQNITFVVNQALGNLLIICSLVKDFQSILSRRMTQMKSGG